MFGSGTLNRDGQVPIKGIDYVAEANQINLLGTNLATGSASRRTGRPQG
jgi:hypothetical protein